MRMSTYLGKRKVREGEDTDKGRTHGSTLFVSNLPYTATSTDLNTLFSDLAPVRSAFVVTEPGSGVSKGVGYVSFAIREDAQSAFEKISAEGIRLDGRSLRVQWAESKGKDKVKREKDPQRKVEDEAEAPTSRPRHPTGHCDPLAIRTVVISGLPSSADSKTLWKKVRKFGGAEKVDWPVTENGNEDRTTAHALFSTSASASEAVNKLHAHVFKGSLLSATLKKRLDGLARTPKKLAAMAKDKGVAPSRASRLIVRNLPFNITEQDLRAMFLPYGPIHSINLPTIKEEGEEGNGDVKTRAKGFAFVWMLSRKDAERALEGCNGMAVQAGMAQRMVADKQKRKKQKREEEKVLKAKERREAEREKAKEPAEGHLDSGDESEAEAEDTDGKGMNARQRVIAVDWALSKDKWEKEKAKIEQEEEDDVKMEEGENDSDDESVSEDSGSEDEVKDDQLGVHEDGSASEGSDACDDDDMEEDNEDQQPAKPTLPPPETGTTLFVRNVPFEATEDELRTLFRAFGPLRYARMTIDPETDRSRGTGFVCFWNKVDADKAIEQSEILRAETVGEKPITPKKNPFKLPSLLTPDPSASVAQNLVLHGRTLDVIRAVTRDQASKLKEEGEKQREKADKRNLYLLREGIILPNTPAAESIPAMEVERRTQSYNARRALLRSNPSLYVSRTRLSVRQLPIFVTERMLKRLAIHAMRAFEKEVKDNVRERLSDDELLERPLAEDKVAQPKQKPRKGERITGVKQAKIVRQADRVDPVTGKGRSKGYGFIEMMEHADALRVLRWANNNLGVGPLFEEWWKAELEDLVSVEKKKPKKDEQRIKRLNEELERGAPIKSKGTLIVEFSIENVQVVQRRAAQQRERHQKTGNSKTMQSPPDVKREQLEERPKKKRRASEPSSQLQEPMEKGQTLKVSKQVSSLIGRKRKERKARKGGG